MHMAMADRSSRMNPMDARIPCPVCGQEIHPVAGRCKHCKTDLVKLRVRAPRIDPGVIGVAAAAPPPQSAPFAPLAPVPAPAPMMVDLPTNGHDHERASHLLVEAQPARCD